MTENVKNGQKNDCWFYEKKNISYVHAWSIFLLYLSVTNYSPEAFYF